MKRVVDVVARSAAPDRERPVAGDSSSEFDILRVEFRDQGATPHLIDIAERLENNSVAWGTVDSRTWLLLAAARLEIGDEDGAARLLLRYVSRFGPVEVDTTLPLASFARDIGVRSAEIDRAAAIWDVLQSPASLSDLVGNKSVAVVGNGPGPLGKGQGTQIDAHDIVVRFNNFPAGYEADYGSRTDIWVRGAHSDVVDRPFLEDFALVLWEMDFARNFLEHASHAEILFRDAMMAPEKLAYLGSDIKTRLREESGLLLPTSGAQMIWALHEARGSLNGVDVYGFSALEGSGDYGHYFDDLGDMGTRHDVDGEGVFLRELFGGPEPEASGQLTIVNSAYRVYDPSTGRTGGPAGVLATQRLALGDEHRGHEMIYIFDDGDKGELKRSMPHLFAGLSGKPSDLLFGAEHVRTHPDVTAAISRGARVLMVCHDLGSAFGAYLLGVPYVIIYHQQGSTLQEMRSIGRTPTAHEITASTKLEHLICANAERMYFPSDGARQSFVDTADPALVESVAFADEPLYNTLSAVDHAKEEGSADLIAQLVRKLALPEKDDSLDVFMSVGDWNGDKGLDRVPELLSAYRKRSGRRVLWIAIGSAIDPARFRAAEEAAKTWSFESRLIGQRLTHDKLLALLDYADFYVMMHRQSIFDLATLEAMRAGKGLILTPVGGNQEFNRADNVEFVTESTLDDAVDAILRRDKTKWGASNRRVFDERFSLGEFTARYRAMLDVHLGMMEEKSSTR